MGRKTLPKGAVLWAWLTPSGKLAPCLDERDARALLGRGIAALVKITLKKRVYVSSTREGL